METIDDRFNLTFVLKLELDKKILGVLSRIKQIYNRCSTFSWFVETYSLPNFVFSAPIRSFTAKKKSAKAVKKAKKIRKKKKNDLMWLRIRGVFGVGQGRGHDIYPIMVNRLDKLFRKLVDETLYHNHLLSERYWQSNLILKSQNTQVLQLNKWLE